MRRPRPRLTATLPLLVLFIYYSAFLSVYGMLALLALAAMALLINRSGNARLSGLPETLAPFIFLYLAVQFDPSTTPMAESGPGLYDYFLVLTTIAGLMTVVLGRFLALEAEPHGETRAADRWFLILSAAGFLFHAALGQPADDMGDTFARIAVFAAYLGVYFLARSGGARLAGAMPRLLAVLAVVAVVSCAVRYGVVLDRCNEAEKLLKDDKEASEALTMLRETSGLERSLKLRPLSARIHYDTGLACFFEGRTAEALHELKAFEGLAGPTNASSMLIGGIHIRLGEWREAVTALERAVSLRPRAGIQPLAVSYAMTGDWERGAWLKGYKKPLCEWGGKPSVLVPLSRALNRWGRWSDAEKCARKALLSDKYDPGALLELAKAMEGQGKAEEAGKGYRDVLTLVPGNIAAIGRLEVIDRGKGLDGEAGRLRMAGLSAETKEVDVNTFSNTKGVYQKDGELRFYLNGRAEARVSLYRGRVMFRFTARGEPSGGVFPVLAVRLGGAKAGEVTVGSRDWSEYSMPIDIKDAGETTFSLEFVNHSSGPGEDRNLYVERPVFERGPDGR